MKFFVKSPKKKAKIYRAQLYKNNGIKKSTGEVLSESQKSFRKGYLQARRDVAEVKAYYDAKHPKEPTDYYDFTYIDPPGYKK